MSGSTVTKSAIRPWVLSKEQIEALPLLNFSGDSTKATGGWQQIFSNPDTPTNELNIGIARFPPHSDSRESFEALHKHKQAEFYYILSGTAVVRIEGTDYVASPGHALYIPGDAEHGFWNEDTEKELVFLWGFACDGFRDVIYRFTDDPVQWRAE